MTILSHLKCMKCDSTAGFKHFSATIFQCKSCTRSYSSLNGFPYFMNKDRVEWSDYIEYMLTANPSFFDPDGTEVARERYKSKLDIKDAHTRQFLLRYPGETVLDLGCGYGAQLELLSEFYKEIDGCDSNYLRLSTAQKKCPSANLIIADITDTPYLSDYFDIVYCCHVLEHMKDFIDGFNEIYRLVKPGRYAIISGPNEGAPWWQLQMELDPDICKNTDHKVFFTAKEWEQAALAVGFEQVELAYREYGLPHAKADMAIHQIEGFSTYFEKLGRTYFEDQAGGWICAVRKPKQ